MKIPKRSQIRGLCTQLKEIREEFRCLKEEFQYFKSNVPTNQKLTAMLICLGFKLLNVSKRNKCKCHEDNNNLVEEVNSFKEQIKQIPNIIQKSSLQKKRFDHVTMLNSESWCKSLITISIKESFIGGRELLQFSSNSFNTMSYSPSSFDKLGFEVKNSITKLLITGHDNGTINVWNVDTNINVASQNNAHENPVFALAALNTQKDCFISGEYLRPTCNGLSHLWRVQICEGSIKLKIIKSIKLKNDGVWGFCPLKNLQLSEAKQETPKIGLVFSNLNKVLSQINPKPTTNLLKLNSGLSLSSFKHSANNFQQEETQIDEKVACSMSNGKVMLWNLKRNEVTELPVSLKSTIRAIIELEKKNTLIIASKENEIAQLAMQTNSAQYFNKEHDNGILALANVLQFFGADFASSGNDHKIKLWSLNSKASISTIQIHTTSVTSLHYISSFNLLISSSADGKIVFYDLQAKAVLKEIKPQVEGISKMTICTPEELKSLKLITIFSSSKVITTISN